MRWSHTGSVIFIGNTALKVTTRKQNCATRDSTEIELVAVADTLLDKLARRMVDKSGI